MDEPRRPEPDLTVLWQRHLPEGHHGAPAFAGMAQDVARALAEQGAAEAEKGDLVVIIARRPPLSERVMPPVTVGRRWDA